MRLALAALALAGCSFLGVHGPPNAPLPDMQFECTNSRGWPIADAVWSAVFVGGAIGALIQSRAPDARPHDVPAAISMLVGGLGFAVSAAVGFDRVGACRDALRSPM